MHRPAAGPDVPKGNNLLPLIGAGVAAAAGIGAAASTAGNSNPSSP